MLHQPSDKVISLPAQPVLVVRALECIYSIPAQRQIDMHSGAVSLDLRLRHECSMEPVPFRNRLDHHLERHQIVRRDKRFVIAEINLMLRRRDLMM